MERSEEAVGLAVAGAAVLLALALALAHGGQSAAVSSCTMPAATGEYRRADAVPLFELPDTGGFLVGGQPISRERLEPTLHDVFASRDGAPRVAFVWPAGAGRCPDLQFLEQAARAAGGRLFDAAASGWPREAVSSP